MKKLTTIMAVFAISSSAIANPIDLQKAKSIASQYIKPGHAMSLVKKALRTKGRKVNAATAQSSPYYIYSRGENQGYVIVSGDDCLPQILGYTESGDFDENNLPPALEYMLNCWQTSVETAQESGINTPMSSASIPLTAAADRVNIAPLTTSHWHQTGPYNDLAPNRDDNGAKSMTGCVATAISQILYYWRKDLPSTLQATTPTYGMDGYSHASVTLSIPKGTPLKWDLMLDSYNGAPKEYNEAVATMVYAVGTAARLEYSIEGGTATSGHIEDIPNAISNYFGMRGGWVAYRSSYSQENWTQLIYDQLAKGRPVMYTGVHETSGGHAVYIDGYQKKDDLMHFNFGWGGQSDGYYTTTLETGMNGFKDYQSALIDAYPKKWNLKASIGLPPHSYANIENEYKVKIENNSTLAFSGVYVFASSTTSKPTNLSSAKSFDTETLIPSGESGIVKLTAKPTSVKTWYITVTDENLNVLAQQAVEVESADAKLSSTAIEACGSSDVVEASDNKFVKIYNNKATINAYVHNSSDIAFGGNAKIDIYQSADNGATFEFLKTVTKSNVLVPAHEDVCVSFSATGLNADNLYYAEVSTEWGSTSSKADVETSKSGKCYFCITGESDLNAALNGTELVFSGHWDPAQFSSIVARSTNKKATSYDITSVESVSQVPATEYPFANAIVYASGSAKGDNVVVDGAFVGDVRVVAGNDFILKKDMEANGNLFLDINQEPNRWYQLTVPFDVEVPDGVLANQINTHKNSTTGITGSTTLVSVLEAGKTYLVMTSSKQRQVLTSSGKKIVKAEPVEGVDTAFVGNYTSIAVPSGSMTIKDKEDKQYYMLASDGETVEGLRGYFYDANKPASVTEFRAYSSVTLDPAYAELGKRIQMMYDAYDDSKSIVTAEGNNAMLDSISNAEKVFSTQSITSGASVKKYYTALEAWVAEYKTMVGSVGDTEIDMTAAIANPSFEESASIVKGWTSEVSADSKVRANSSLAYKTVYGDGANYLYNSKGTTVSQTLSGLKTGYYRLTAMVGSDEGNTITLFAGDSIATVEAHSFGKHYLTEAVIEDILVDETGMLTIGVKADNWYNADDFKLVFIGNSETDAIIDIENVLHSAKGVYTIMGTKIEDALAPGLYIIDGKKTLVK